MASTSESDPHEELIENALFYLEYSRDELSNGYDSPSPQLEVTIGPLHERLSNIREADQENGWYVIGGFEQVGIVSVDVDEAKQEALVQFCHADLSRLVLGDGAPVGPAGDGEPRLGFLFAVLTESGWKFDEIIFENKRCDPTLYER